MVVQDMLELYGREYECIWFENDPEACLKNVRTRNDGREVESSIKILSKMYVPGKSAIPCYQG